MNTFIPEIEPIESCRARLRLAIYRIWTAEELQAIDMDDERPEISDALRDNVFRIMDGNIEQRVTITAVRTKDVRRVLVFISVLWAAQTTTAEAVDRLDRTLGDLCGWTEQQRRTLVTRGAGISLAPRWIGMSVTLEDWNVLTEAKG